MENAVIERIKAIVAKRFPTDYLCKRMKKKTEEAREVRLQKWLKELEGLTAEETELKIKEWESK